MSDFENQEERDGLTLKLWRGERMCLLGFDVSQPAPDFVGFAVECQEPGSSSFEPLLNRLAFSYPPGQPVTGARLYPSPDSPFQKFRWIHFPHDPQPGKYTYRVTQMHMSQDEHLRRGASVTLDLPLYPETYQGFLDVGFTRNFASSQAFNERYGAIADRIIPAQADQGLGFPKVPGSDVYEWLGFEAYDMLFRFLDRSVADPAVTLDVLAYDLNEPDVVERLEKLGNRLRIVIDDSGDHGTATSAETRAAERLQASRAQVRRTHFKNLQHHKVLVARRDGRPERVLAGSMNFSFRGLYIQANNVLVFSSPEVAGLYGRVFDAAFDDPAGFAGSALARQWHTVQVPGQPAVYGCFSPHRSADLSLNPVRGAIDQATSSVLYAVAFLNLLKSGPTKEAFDRLMRRNTFSYGISDKEGGLEVHKPNGSVGLVDFAYLSKNAPPPFRAEWSGGKGVNIHHKFVITDFNLPGATVFTGSSNLAPSGEKGNGDNLLMIRDRKIATSFAIEALRVFDHLHFRSRLRDAKASRSAAPLTLLKPTVLSGKPAWFEEFYQAGSTAEADRRLFSR